MLPQIYTAVSGLSVLDGATMWAGRREESPFLMSSGLPPNSPAMRFGVDNARFGDIGLNYQYTTRNDIGGQSLPSYHSVRTGPIATNEQGSVQLGFTHVEAQPLVQATGGAWASAMHEQKGVLAGTNRLGLQFGEGARTAMTGYSGMGPALSRVRMAESLEWKRADGLGLAGSVSPACSSTARRSACCNGPLRGCGPPTWPAIASSSPSRWRTTRSRRASAWPGNAPR